MTVRIAVLADDLSGTLAPATQLKLAGCRVDVASELDELAGVGAPAVVDMRNRDAIVDHRAAAGSRARLLAEMEFVRFGCRIEHNERAFVR